MVESIVEAVKTTEGSTREGDHLELLMTKGLAILDLSSFPRLDSKLAAHLLLTAANQQSVTILPHVRFT